MLKQLLQLMSPAGKRARLSVLMLHRVLPAPDPLCPGEMYASLFDELCGWMASWFNVLPLDVAVSHLKAGTLPARAACITFDDGYADNHDIALPILKRHDLCATIFVATGFLDGGRMWNDTIIETIRGCRTTELDLASLGFGVYRLDSLDGKHAAIESLIEQVKYIPTVDRILITDRIAELAKVPMPSNLMMTSNQVKSIHEAGMQIGVHTVSHPVLVRLTSEQVHNEISASRGYLEKLLGQRVGLFAYPYGKPGKHYSAETSDVVSSLGFDAAVCTQWGTTCKDDDIFQIRRFTPWDKTRLRFGLRMLKNFRVP